MVPQMACAAPWNARGVMVAALMVLAMARVVGVVRAQTSCSADTVTDLYAACNEYVMSEDSPDMGCCSETQSVLASFGNDCCCQLLLETWTPATAGQNMSKVYVLPQICQADANTCPSAPAPSSSDPVPPSSSTPLLSPPGLLTSPPPDGLQSPPSPPSPSGGSSTPTTSPSPPPGSKSSGSSSRLAVPIGASVGGVSAGVLLLYLILSCKFKWNLKWDLNNPCSCCGPRKPNDDKSNGAGVQPVKRMHSAAFNAASAY